MTAPVIRTIPTKFPNTKCRTCGKAIALGQDVRWIKGVKGVTCVTCPSGQVVNATTGEPVQTETAYESLSRRLAAALSDGQALRAEIGRMAAQIQALTVERDALFAEATALAHEVAACGPANPMSLGELFDRGLPDASDPQL